MHMAIVLLFSTPIKITHEYFWQQVKMIEKVKFSVKQKTAENSGLKDLVLINHFYCLSLLILHEDCWKSKPLGRRCVFSRHMVFLIPPHFTNFSSWLDLIHSIRYLCFCRSLRIGKVKTNCLWGRSSSTSSDRYSEKRSVPFCEQCVQSSSDTNKTLYRRSPHKFISRCWMKAHIM